MTESFAVVVPWHNREQLNRWISAWNVDECRPPNWLFTTQDVRTAEPHAIGSPGCGAVKNRGIRDALAAGYNTVVVLDDDCFPTRDSRYWPDHMLYPSPDVLERFALAHVRALQPQPVKNFICVTDPISRGTPYFDESRHIKLPVAASMGFWEEIGDYCSPRQLAFAGAAMNFDSGTVFGQYFALSGMNLAFRAADWMPWCQFIDVARFDDIWMGLMWQREAYRRVHCFNLDGPRVRHSRQSNVWKNLKIEAQYLEQNETLWQQIMTHPDGSYRGLCNLLPVP